MPIDANGPADRVEQLIVLTEKLTEMIAREAELVEQRDAAGLGKAAEEKERLAALYAQEMSRVAKDKSLISGAGPELTSRFKSLTARLREKIEAHARTLNAARQVTEGMIRAVAQEVAGSTRPMQGYGGKAMPVDAGRPTAFALNQVV